ASTSPNLAATSSRCGRSHGSDATAELNVPPAQAGVADARASAVSTGKTRPSPGVARRPCRAGGRARASPRRYNGAFRLPAGTMDAGRIDRYVDTKWDDDIIPQLVEYIRIPNKSPMFDADWEKNGYMADAVKLMESWARAQDIPGMVVEVV